MGILIFLTMLVASAHAAEDPYAELDNDASDPYSKFEKEIEDDCPFC